MGIKVALEHRTSYTFDRLVEVHPHVVRLRPAPHSRTPIEAYSLQVEPADHFVNWQQDAFGNFLARLVFPDRARSLTITVGLIADMKVDQPVRLLHRGVGRARRRSNTPRRWPRTSSRTCGPSTRTARAPGPASSPGSGCRTSPSPPASAPSTSWSRSTARSTPTSATACGWNPACRRPTTPCAPGSGRAATRPGCWCRSCANSGWPPASCPATWCS